MSVTADLAMDAMPQKLEEDKVREGLQIMPGLSTLIGVLRKTEQQ